MIQGNIMSIFNSFNLGHHSLRFLFDYYYKFFKTRVAFVECFIDHPVVTFLGVIGSVDEFKFVLNNIELPQCPKRTTHDVAFCDKKDSRLSAEDI
jgi:hypothetical protein